MRYDKCTQPVNTATRFLQYTAVDVNVRFSVKAILLKRQKINVAMTLCALREHCSQTGRHKERS